jgi:thiamine-monophosphate kinase
VGCRVDLDLLPVAEDTRSFVASLGYDPVALAATGGEDYELLISAPEPALEALAESVAVPVTRVGEVTDGGGVVFRRGGGIVEGLSGWDHFV